MGTVLNIFNILRFDRNADGEINLASFCSSGDAVRRWGVWIFSSTVLDGLHNVPPYWGTVLPRDVAFWEQY